MVQIYHNMQCLKYTNVVIYIVIKYKNIPVTVNASKAISFEYDLICHYDYWTNKSFTPA